MQILSDEGVSASLALCASKYTGKIQRIDGYQLLQHALKAE